MGKVICGYQGWFNCSGDGSPVERRVHWSRGTYKTNEGLPSPGYLSFEMYPDVSEYQFSSLFQTGFANLGDGKPSVLFSSIKKDVMDTHFSWMKQYGNGCSFAAVSDYRRGFRQNHVEGIVHLNVNRKIRWPSTCGQWPKNISVFFT